jgi:hypothetical protein
MIGAVRDESALGALRDSLAAEQSLDAATLVALNFVVERLSG